MSGHPLLVGFKEFCAEAYRGGEAIMPRLVEDGQYFRIILLFPVSIPVRIWELSLRLNLVHFFSHKAMGAIVPPLLQGNSSFCRASICALSQ